MSDASHRVDTANLPLLLQLQLILGQARCQGDQLSISFFQFVLVIVVLALVSLHLFPNLEFESLILSHQLLNPRSRLSLVLLPDADLLIILQLEGLHLLDLAGQLLLQSLLGARNNS